MVRRIGLLLGAVCFAALAWLNGPTVEPSAQVQFVLFAAGVALLIYGFGAPSMARGRFPAHGGWLIVVLLLAAGLRLWNLENAVHFYVDEGNFVEGILHLETEPTIRLMSPFNYVAAFTWIYPVLQTASVAVFGHNLLGLRVVSAAFGLLTVAAVYRLGRVLFDARIGLLAALLLATFPPHLHFSRLGLNNIADPLFGTLALAWLAQGLRHGHWRDFALAGVWLGLTQYFYEGGRLLYPALVLVWGMIAGLAWKGCWRASLLTGGIAALVAAPVYTTLLAWDISLTTRLTRRGFDPDYWRQILLAPGGGALMTHVREHVIPPFLHYVTLPDVGAFYYGGHTALILPPLVPVFLGGIVAALRRTAVAGLLPLLWLIFTALGNSMIRDSVWTSRYVAAFPALALLLAVGLDGAGRFIARWLKIRDQHKGTEGQRSQRKTLSICLVLAELMEITSPRLASLTFPPPCMERRGRTAGSEEVRSATNPRKGQIPPKKLEPTIFPRHFRVFAFIVLLVAGGQVIYYFGPHLTAYQTQIRPYHDQQDVVFRVRDLPPDTDVYLITDDPDLWMPLLVFLSRYWGMPDFAPQLRHPAYLDGWEALDQLDAAKSHAFFYEQEDTRTQAYLQARLGLGDPIYSPYNVPREKQFALLLLPPDTIESF